MQDLYHIDIQMLVVKPHARNLYWNGDLIQYH